MGQKFTNNARSRLVGALSNSATSFTVESATADLFPIGTTSDWLTTLDWFKATIENSLGQIEIVKVGTRSLGSGVFSNVQRGQDGTTAIAFDAGAVVGLRITATDLEDSIQRALNAVQLEGNESIDGIKTFLQTIIGDLQGNADTATLAALASVAASADALKADIVIPTGATGTTQAAKDATTKMATTAFADRMRSMLSSTNASTLILADRGSVVRRAATTTVPSGVFAANDVVTVKNTSNVNISLVQGSGLTMRKAGTTVTGDLTIGPYGFATILFDSGTECAAAGPGVF